MTREMTVRTPSGWLVMPLWFAAGFGCFFLIKGSFDTSFGDEPHLRSGWMLAGGILATLVWVPCVFGLYTLQPNQSAVLTLFGAYHGTAKTCGFWWTNPFMAKKKVSLRAHNLNGQKLKVNDKLGNPVEIAAVVVWRVQDTAQACFDVEDYQEYVSVQSESAVRHLATRYPYDTTEHETLSLRANFDEVSLDLQRELSERFARAGVMVDEARLTHLAYAPEIAQAMLRRQQAEAIVSARTRIVEGAVGMVELALARLDEHGTIKLDDERRAAMVSNLLVVLCGEREASPVINAGTLYN